MNARVKRALMPAVVAAVLIAAGLAGCAAGDTNFTNVVASGSVTAGTTLTGKKLVITPATSITVTAGLAVQPAGSYQPVAAAGAVTATLSATGAAAGQVVRLVNTGTNAITWTDTGITKLAGNFAAGQYDSLTAVFDGANWVELARADN